MCEFVVSRASYRDVVNPDQVGAVKADGIPTPDILMVSTAFRVSHQSIKEVVPHKCREQQATRWP